MLGAMRPISILLLSLATVLPAAEMPRTITVPGTVVADLAPDGARFELVVASRAATTGAARAANRSAVEAVLAKIHAAGLAPERTTRSALEQGRAWDRGERGEVVWSGWACTTRLAVVVDDLARLDAVVDAIAASEGVETSGFAFTRTDEIPQRAAVRLKALAAARDKAAALAAAAGCALGEPRTIRETEQGGWNPYANRAYNGEVQGVFNDATAQASAGASLIRVSAGVEATWDLVPLVR